MDQSICLSDLLVVKTILDPSQVNLGYPSLGIFPCTFLDLDRSFGQSHFMRAIQRCSSPFPEDC
jgi:hypothetical protein